MSQSAEIRKAPLQGASPHFHDNFFSLPVWKNKFYKQLLYHKNSFWKEVADMKDIDQEFEEFVRKHPKRLTENQKRICEKLGLDVPN